MRSPLQTLANIEMTLHDGRIRVEPDHRDDILCTAHAFCDACLASIASVDGGV